ncbi:MAG: hypothetical protein IJZ42_07200 [Lachnospiraceae bacterium]|nr:hypothetical protein [Lachnospiraceae bacterium]
MNREEVLQARKEKEKLTISCKVTFLENETIKNCCEKLGISKNQFCYDAVFEKLEREGFL